jgi:hypothetical protein
MPAVLFCTEVGGALAGSSIDCGARLQVVNSALKFR